MAHWVESGAQPVERNGEDVHAGGTKTFDGVCGIAREEHRRFDAAHVKSACENYCLVMWAAEHRIVDDDKHSHAQRTMHPAAGAAARKTAAG